MITSPPHRPGKTTTGPPGGQITDLDIVNFIVEQHRGPGKQKVIHRIADIAKWTIDQSQVGGSVQRHFTVIANFHRHVNRVVLVAKDVGSDQFQALRR